MKTWHDFSVEETDLASIGKQLLFPSREHVGLAFIATLRKDGAPRLHPISLVISQGHLYVLIPPASPKCADLIRDGRYALQAYPPFPNADNEEFYLAGRAQRLQDPETRQAIIADTQVVVEEQEEIFELLLDRVMYTKLANRSEPDEHPIHKKWRSSPE